MPGDGGDGERRPGVGQRVLGVDPLLPVELFDPVPREHGGDSLHQHHLVAVRLEGKTSKGFPSAERGGRKKPDFLEM